MVHSHREGAKIMVSNAPVNETNPRAVLAAAPIDLAWPSRRVEPGPARGRPGAIRSLEPALYAPLAALPVPVSSFVGRERELAEIERLLMTGRLVTLTGPGGCGKTRLALEVATRLKERFADGTAFVSLASLEDAGLVAGTIARALDVRESPTEPCWELVADAVGSRELLLVVDNLEHLLDTAWQFAAWLMSCPRLTMLATSRERLRLQGEQVYSVPPLSLPPQGLPTQGQPTRSSRPSEPVATTDVAAASSEAVRLFVERARAIEPRFALTDQTAPAAAEICRRLDGLPLAIELAAARAHLLPPAAMLTRLTGTAQTSSLELLRGGARDLPLRQQTLRRTIAWSYDLLASDEQALLRRLAVFSGSFTLEQAEAICGGVVRNESRVASTTSPDSLLTTPYSLLDMVASLLERNLLRPVQGVADEPRFTMLTTIRAFALEQLEAHGEATEVRRCHAAYYLALAEEAAPHLHERHQASWLDRLDREHDNLRAAMAWSAECDPRAALRLGGALWRFWQVRGHVREGRAWIEHVVETEAIPPGAAHGPEHASALYAAAFLAFIAGEYRRAAEHHRAALAIRRQLGDLDAIAESLNCLGLLLRCVGDYEAAEGLFDEALAVSRRLGNRTREANILNNLARSAYYHGDHLAARALHEQGLAIAREAGDAWVVAICLGDLGDVQQAGGDADSARTLYEDSLAAWRALGDLRGVAQCLEGFAGLTVEAHPDRAVCLFAAAATAREQIGEPCSRVRRNLLSRVLARARAALGSARYAEAWQAGQAMSLDQAIEYAHAQVSTARHPAHATAIASRAGHDLLTRREVEIARLAAEGRSNREIATALVVSERTVGSHLDHIYSKLGVSSRTAVAAYVFRQGLT
jgi:non-specific serine/threonine protein kinase